MAFTWSEQRINWYLDASRHSNFHQRLAEKIAPHLCRGDTVCDLGCGLGQLDLLLAPLVSHITCVDVDALVLESLRAQAATAGIQNLSVQQGDAQRIRQPADVILMAFFGDPPQTMLDFMGLARKRVIRVVNDDTDGASLQPKRHSNRHRGTTWDVAAVLDQAGYAYRLIRDSFEFGQPLRSRQQAEAFVRCNSPSITQGELDDFLAQNLVQTGNKTFPFYLPGSKKLGIFFIDAQPLCKQSVPSPRCG